jgi:hypothetical protein
MACSWIPPFQPVLLSIPAEIPWQDWITSRGVFDNKSGFLRDAPPRDHDDDISQLVAQPQFQPPTGRLALLLNNDAVAQILAATRAQPSWRACELENASWNGTAEENAKKYLDITGR